MNRPGILRVLFLSVVLVMLGWSTESAFAGAHGGGGGGFHGGGGGFHGGGGGGGFHGGGGFGGWHGGGWGGNRGGWGGYRGGYYGGWRGGWGYGGYCCGWGFGIGFNFGPSWGYYGYPYGYGYAPYYSYNPYYPYYPYYPNSAYPYYYAPVGGPPGYSNPAPQNQASGDPQSYTQTQVEQYRVPAPQPPPSSNGLTLRDATYRPAAVSYRAASAPTSASGSGLARAERELATMRPEVQNTIRALRAMPPSARQRQIDSGRYNNLSPQELKVVKYAVKLPL